VPGPVWIVVPTYCEAENLGPLLAGLRAATPPGTRVLVVDDDSPDGTAAIAERLGAEVLRRPRRAGLAGAYRDGFALALARGAGAVVQMDADRSHDPADVPRLLSALDGGADLAIGSRYVPGGGVERWRAWRRAVSRAACAYARVVLRVPARDLTSGFKAWRPEALAAIGFRAARSQGYAFQVELTDRALRRGLRVRELPIVFHERREGHSKLTGRIAAEAVWRVPALRLLRHRAGSPDGYYTF
jgi:dolichol-phosphate mannosyltransferase